MSDLKVGDKVWAPCIVQAISSENTLSLDFTHGWWSPDAVRPHVTPPEPVVLTQSEWDDLYFQLRENEMKPTGVIRWFQDNGFRLVRTGGADGA